MPLNNLTLAERERLAYAEGFTTSAALLAQASDDNLDLEAAQDAAMDAEMENEKREKDQERRIDMLDDDLARMQDKLDEMTALVTAAADYLKDGDVDRAACTLSEALK
jgi:post-segregation antitoxin (ccd killing protein)